MPKLPTIGQHRLTGNEQSLRSLGAGSLVFETWISGQKVIFYKMTLGSEFQQETFFDLYHGHCGRLMRYGALSTPNIGTAGCTQCDLTVLINAKEFRRQRDLFELMS